MPHGEHVHQALEKAEEKRAQLCPPASPPQKTGDVLEPYDARRFEGAADLHLTPEQVAVLTAPLAPEEIQMDPAGPNQRKDELGRPILYLGHLGARRRLMRAFGPGAWAMRPVENAVGRAKEKVTLILQPWDLLVRDGRGKVCFVGRATGECLYVPGNSRMTEGDALEGAQSNALCRICQKAFGMGLELFDRAQREHLHARLSGQAPKTPAEAPSRPVDASSQAQNSKPQSAPETPQRAPSASRTAEKRASSQQPQGTMVLCVVRGVSTKSGAKPNGQPWTNYRIETNKGTYSTFSDTIGGTAVALKDKNAAIWFVPDPKNSKWLVATHIEAAVPASSADRESGMEGQVPF